MIARRGFLTGLGALLAAPAIVHAGNLMPIKGNVLTLEDFCERVMQPMVDQLAHDIAVSMFRIGDIIRFEGVHSVNRLTGQVEPYQRQFVVLSDCDVVHERNIYPPMRENNKDRYRTVDAKPKDWLKIAKVSNDWA